MAALLLFGKRQRTLAGIEMARMIRKGQMDFPLSSSYKTFCCLAGLIQNF